MNPPTSLKLLTALTLLAPSLFADDKLPRAAEIFEVAGHNAHLYAAPPPATGKPWLWFAPTINGVSLAGRKMYFEGLLKAGISISGFDLGEVRGAPASTTKFTLFMKTTPNCSRSATKPAVGRSP